MTTKTSRGPGELVFNGILVLVSMFLVYQSYQISGIGKLSSPGFFPLVASFVMLLSSLSTFWTTLRVKAPSHSLESFFERILPKNILIMLASVLFFVLCLDTLGFISAAFLFLFFTFTVFYRRGWVISLVLSVITLTVVFVIFRMVFLVVLPEGEWLGSLGIPGF
ncbi:tripartite tricarboxylate transporter TctB family protein [Vibrio sp.]|uniref:Tripartite tricarboxylate transporter TctB family protein n=1 Tax=Vibrio viridaestus TaxID=2487322 RepID=A0A3N9TK48_9VIBR|nr:tripartite tricarboxylate transporter TctB family protein [Vibrio viridaestus]MDC0609420.1 tripartite tricarboxylate transporter TctB family protein [Vibrio sp.]RQW64758.1 tripartite tricarboxylate transporter TctB family protein [Vibrio viridaestus]